MRDPAVSRRGFLIGGAAALAAAACGRSDRGAQGYPTPMPADAAQLIDASGPHMVGDDRIAFAVFQGQRPLTFTEGARGTLRIVKPDETRAGPLDLRTFGIARGVGGHAHSEEEPDLLFTAVFAMDQPGFYELEATVEAAGKKHTLHHRLGVAGALTEAQRNQTTLLAGDKAISVATATTKDARGVNPICTRQPACSMHEESLDALLARRVPVVLSFATPAFCTSRMCGPVVDEIESVKNAYTGPARFVHVEVYRDSERVSPDNTTEAFAVWRLDTEPYTFFIDRDGVVRRRISGPLDDVDVRDSLPSIAG